VKSDRVSVAVDHFNDSKKGSTGKHARSISVCIVTQYFPPDMGAASSRALNIATALSKRGHKVTVVTAFPHYPHGRIPKEYGGKFVSKEKANELDVYRVWVPSLPTEGSSRRTIMYLSFAFSCSIMLFVLRNVDLYFYVSPYGASFLSMPTYIRSKLGNAYFAIDQGDPWPDVAVSMGYIHSKSLIEILKLMVRVMYRLADVVCPISAVIGKEILKYGVPKEKVQVIDLGVDTSIFKPSNRTTSSVWERAFQDKFVVEYSGIFGPIYDFESVMKAAKILETTERILFLIRGDGESKEKILQLMKSLALKNVISRGRVDNPVKVAEYLNAADVLLIPLKNEEVLSLIYPYKVIEYLACGKPIIASAKGALVELISGSGAGIVVPPANPESLAEAIMCLYSNEEKRAEMSRKALDLAANRFSFDAVGKKLEQVFAGLRENDEA